MKHLIIRYITEELLKLYGYLTEEAHFHEPFEGNGLITSVFEARGIQFTSKDLYTKPPSIRRFLFRINTISNHFKGIANFFETMAKNGIVCYIYLFIT